MVVLTCRVFLFWKSVFWWVGIGGKEKGIENFSFLCLEEKEDDKVGKKIIPHPNTAWGYLLNAVLFIPLSSGTPPTFRTLSRSVILNFLMLCVCRWRRTKWDDFSFPFASSFVMCGHEMLLELWLGNGGYYEQQYQWSVCKDNKRLLVQSISRWLQSLDGQICIWLDVFECKFASMGCSWLWLKRYKRNEE